MRILIITLLVFSFFPDLHVQGQAIADEHNLKGIWTDKTYLDSLKSHNSLTELFKDRGTVYNGLQIENDTLILALFPRAMEEDWLYYIAPNEQFESRRGFIKITEVLSPKIIKTKVSFNGNTDIKYFVKVMSESEASRTNDPLQLHFQMLYRTWFMGTYQVLDKKNEVIDTAIFTKQGNAAGFFNNSLYNFFLWDEGTAVLNIENWQTKEETYYIITYSDSKFKLIQVNEPEWDQRPKTLVPTDKKIFLIKSH